MKDYVFASGKEKEFVDMAKKLGYDELVFLSGDASKIKNFKVSSSKRVFRSDASKDRNLIEGKRADMIFDFEMLNRKDAMHFRNSGMNHILAELMRKNDVFYGLSFSSVLNSAGMERAKVIGRMMQNISLCRKYKTGVVVASFAHNPYEMRDPKDLIAFSRLLGLENY